MNAGLGVMMWIGLLIGLGGGCGGPPGHEARQAEDARAADDEHVVAPGLAQDRAERGWDHQELPRPPRAGGGDADHPDPLERLLGGPREIPPPGHDGRRVSRRDEGRAEPADVGLAAPEHGVERLGEEEDARQRALRRSWIT